VECLLPGKISLLFIPLTLVFTIGIFHLSLVVVREL
jgi:hypothetical protein